MSGPKGTLLSNASSTSWLFTFFPQAPQAREMALTTPSAPTLAPFRLSCCSVHSAGSRASSLLLATAGGTGVTGSPQVQGGPCLASSARPHRHQRTSGTLRQRDRRNAPPGDLPWPPQQAAAEAAARRQRSRGPGWHTQPRRAPALPAAAGAQRRDGGSGCCSPLLQPLPGARPSRHRRGAAPGPAGRRCCRGRWYKRRWGPAADRPSHPRAPAIPGLERLTEATRRREAAPRRGPGGRGSPGNAARRRTVDLPRRE